MKSLGFVVNVYNEGPLQLGNCLSSIREFYPNNKILVISDGVDEYNDVCLKHNCRYIVGHRLKTVENGGAWIKRTLESFLDDPSDIMIKMDPDSQLFRKLRIPEEADYFGHKNKPIRFTGSRTDEIKDILVKAGGRLSPAEMSKRLKKSTRELVHGMCKGVSLEAINKILESGRLNDKIYTARRYQHRVQTGVVFEDLIFYEIVEDLGLKIEYWEECTNGGFKEEGDFACRHPIKVCNKCVMTVVSGKLYSIMSELMIESLDFKGKLFVIDSNNPQEDKIKTLIEKIKEGYRVALVDSDIIFHKPIDEFLNSDELIVSRGPTLVNNKSHSTVKGCLSKREIKRFKGREVPNTGFVIADKRHLDDIEKWYNYRKGFGCNDDQSPLVALYLRGKVNLKLVDICSYPNQRYFTAKPYFSHFAGGKSNPSKAISDMNKARNGIKISFCIPCMNRLWQLKQTIHANLKVIKDNGHQLCLLNYNSTDGLDEFVRLGLSEYIKDGTLKYFHTKEPQYYDMARAKNLAHFLGGNEFLYNLDADNFITQEEMDYLAQCVSFELYHNYPHAKGEKDKDFWFVGLWGRIMIKRSLFHEIGGYSEQLLGYGYDDIDFYNRCKAARMCTHINGIVYATPIQNNDEERVCNTKDPSIGFADQDARNKELSQTPKANEPRHYVGVLNLSEKVTITTWDDGFEDDRIKLISDSIAKLTLINFEITDKCNYDKLHKACPINSKSRFNNNASDVPISDGDIIGLMSYCINRGFKGYFGFHYYNEPLLERDRITRIMTEINSRFPSVKFCLWTNGSMLKDREVHKYDKVVISDYKKNKAHLAANKNVHVLSGKLDKRRKIEDAKVKLSNCARVNLEMSVDYYGNIRVCCNDYKHEITSANITQSDYTTCLMKWVEAKTVPETMANTGKSHAVCRSCIKREGKYKSGSIAFLPKYDKKPVFIHVPKAAGCSIINALAKHGITSAGHDIQAKKRIGTYRIGFVRHPVDRLYSAWRFLISGGKTVHELVEKGMSHDEAYAVVARGNNYADNPLINGFKLSQMLKSKYANFEEFCLGFRDDTDLAPNGEEIRHYHLFRPQTDYLCKEGKLLCDFVGKYETLQQDWIRLCSILGIEEDLPIINRTIIPQSELDITDSAVKTIENAYKMDYVLFGYQR